MYIRNMYKNFLNEIIQDNGLNNLEHKSWNKLFEHITQDVLNDAHSKSDEVINLYKPLKIISRKCKKIERIRDKNKEQKYCKSFKVNSDFLAFRVKVSEITNIPAVTDYIVKTTKKHGGISFIRNGIIDEVSNMTDIIQYVFIYIPSIGYIMEFQIGHPFAMYVFTNDSLIRDGNTSVVDLWDNNFYTNVVKYILTGEPCDILAEINELYEDKTIPKEFLNILQAINSE